MAASRAFAGGGNQPPQIVQGDTANLTVGKNTLCPNISNRIRFDATDPDGAAASLIWTLQTAPATGTISFLTTNPRSFVIACYQPNTGQATPDSFVVRVADPGGAFDDVLVSVTVTNQPPDIAQGSVLNFAVGEDTVCPGAANQFALSAADPDGPVASLNWSIQTGPTLGAATFIGGMAGAAVTICYAPAANQEAAASFVVKVTDDLGAMDTIAVNVSINAVADCPVISQGETLNLNVVEDSLCAGAGNTIVLGAVDPDTAAGSLNWSATTPANGVVSFPIGQAGSSVQICYTPSANYFGPDSFQVSVSDGTCGVPDTISISVNVASVLDCPIISQGASVPLNVQEDSTCVSPANRLALSATDADSSTTVLQWQSTTPANGAVSFIGGQAGAAVEVCYTPNFNANGPDIFSVSVTDGDCGAAASINVNVAISPINDCPVLLVGGPIPMTVLRNSGCGGAGNTIPLSADDVDTSTGLLLWSATPPTKGVVSFPTGNAGSSVQLCFTPTPGAIGTDNFTVEVTDGGCPAPVQVNVTIECGTIGGADCNNNGTPDTCEVDSDGDGVINDCDGCPNDPARSVLGPCGCGLPPQFDCREVCEPADISSPALLSAVQDATFPERRCDGSLPPRLFVGRTEAAGLSKVLRIKQDCSAQLYGPLLSRPESVLIDANNYWPSGCPTQNKLIIGRYDGQGHDFLYFVNLLNGTICEQYTDDTILHVGQMALSSTGQLFLGSVEGNHLSVLQKGVVSPFYTAAGQSPRAVAIDAADAIYLTCAVDGIMRHIAPNGVVLNANLASGLQGAVSQAISPPGIFGGRMVVACGDRLMRVDLANGAANVFAANLPSYGAAFDADGYLYVSSPEQDRIVRIGPRPADVNHDGAIDELDVPVLASCLLGDAQAGPLWHGDVNEDGCPNGRDIQSFVAAMMSTIAP